MANTTTHHHHHHFQRYRIFIFTCSITTALPGSKSLSIGFTCGYCCCFPKRTCFLSIRIQVFIMKLNKNVWFPWLVVWHTHTHTHKHKNIQFQRKKKHNFVVHLYNFRNFFVNSDGKMFNWNLNWFINNKRQEIILIN